MIWREILLQLFSLSGDEGDEHKWVIPSAVSADSHKELTVRQIIQHFGFFASDAALEDKIFVKILGSRPGIMWTCIVSVTTIASIMSEGEGIQ
jgi:hypothetical protein